MPPVPGVPALPPSWPYPPRPASPPPAVTEGVGLPGLDGLWTLTAVPGLDLEAPRAELGGAFGRGGVFRCGDVVLRPYRRGGLVRFLNGRVYAGPGRFEAEFKVHRALWDAGLPTVEPLGWASRPRSWGCEGVFLTRREEGTPWPRGWDPGALPQVRTLLEALCAWGLYAPDLNATNFLVRPDGQVLALDWDRAVWVQAMKFPALGVQAVPLLDRYRARLTRSLMKLGAPRDFVV